MDKLLPFLCRYLPKWLEPLYDLALDLHWTWNHGSDQLWETIAPQAWQSTQNLRWILQSTSEKRLEQLSKDERFKIIASNY